MPKEPLTQGLFRRGAATLCVLALLNQKEWYGYDLTQNVERISEGRFAMAEGTLYPILYRLESQGYVTSRYEFVGKRMRRAYYTITEEGQRYYQTLLDEYASVQEGIRLIVSYRGDSKE